MGTGLGDSIGPYPGNPERLCAITWDLQAAEALSLAGGSVASASAPRLGRLCGSRLISATRTTSIVSCRVRLMIVVPDASGLGIIGEKFRKRNRLNVPI